MIQVTKLIQKNNRTKNQHHTDDELQRQTRHRKSILDTIKTVRIRLTVLADVPFHKQADRYKGYYQR